MYDATVAYRKGLLLRREYLSDAHGVTLIHAHIVQPNCKTRRLAPPIFADVISNSAHSSHDVVIDNQSHVS